jgi:methylenetetrahydrofolate dehydrogenase (NADP+)/methenyltetrahydrofolate cyclohydrolase
MSAQLMKGLAPAECLRIRIAAQAQKMRTNGITPRLNVLLPGNDQASRLYASAKARLGNSLGIMVDVRAVGEEGFEEALRLLQAWNEDAAVHGILVELPLPPGWDKSALLAAIDPHKDVDGVHPLNRGYLLDGQEEKALLPATPLACLALLDYYQISLGGKRITLVGRGDTVGRPLGSMLIKRDATLTICHSKSKDLAWHCRQAEILVAAAGKPGLITPDMVRPGAVVLDAGVSYLKDGKSVQGDVAPAASEAAAYMSPVPGGVGTLTTTVIMANLLKALKLQIPDQRCFHF